MVNNDYIWIYMGFSRNGEYPKMDFTGLSGSHLFDHHKMPASKAHVSICACHPCTADRVVIVSMSANQVSTRANVGGVSRYSRRQLFPEALELKEFGIIC